MYLQITVRGVGELAGSHLEIPGDGRAAIGDGEDVEFGLEGWIAFSSICVPIGDFQQCPGNGSAVGEYLVELDDGPAEGTFSALGCRTPVASEGMCR